VRNIEMNNIYKGWGFSDNPFSVVPLAADDLGDMLLVGRDEELTKLTKRLVNPPKIATLEGANGVGKTSLVNVSAWRLFKNYATRKDSQLLIPCRRSFQLSGDAGGTVSLADFSNEVLIEVAQTLIDRAAQIRALGRPDLPATTAIDKWLNAPQLVSLQASLSSFGIGASRETNTSNGFLNSGFRKQVESWLESIFPDGRTGGVVCVLDNLELLQTTENARQLLEELRDSIFTMKGLRWVLCGATGILQSVAASPRLEGYLHPPIEVAGLNLTAASEVLNSRFEAFSEVGGNPYLPINKAEFERLHTLLNKNLRSVLSQSDNYCLWASDFPMCADASEKEARFNQWLIAHATGLHDAASLQLTPRAWDAFDTAIHLGGAFSPSDFEKFGCNSPQALRPYVQALEQANLFKSWRDDSDRRRKSVEVTPNGFLVNYARQNRPTSSPS